MLGVNRLSRSLTLDSDPLRGCKYASRNPFRSGARVAEKRMSDLLQFRVSVAANEMYQLHLSHSTDSLAHTTEFVLRHDADGHDVHLIQIVSRHLSHH